MTETTAAFFGRVRAAFDDAAAQAGTLERRYRIAGRCVRLRFAGSRLAELLTPALAHAADESATAPDLTVLLTDSGSAGVSLPRPGWAAEDYWHRGEVLADGSDRVRVAFDQGAAAVSLLDRDAGTAVYWALDGSPAYERAAPLRTILSWWLEPNGLQLAHGGAVGTAGDGVLLAGRGGAGKSTTALACALAGMDFLGDDYVAVSPAGVLAAYGTYSSAKVSARTLALLPELAPLVAIGETPEEEKSVLFLSPRLSAQLKPKLELRAVVIPVVSDRGRAHLTPMSPAAAYRDLALSTVYQLPGAGQGTFQRLASLLRELPAWKLELGPDPLDAAAALRAFLAAEVSG
jgi:hypothetical protein